METFLPPPPSTSKPMEAVEDAKVVKPPPASTDVMMVEEEHLHVETTRAQQPSRDTTSPAKPFLLRRPPPVSPFSRTRPSLPPLTLTSSIPTIQRSKFSIGKPKQPKNSRTAFLTAALSPSFVSAKPLHTRAHTTISEVVGNLAPERYLSLAPRSRPAAKALLATSVCKELRDVKKLETMRKRHGDVAGGGWFDYVLDSLGDGSKTRAFGERMKRLVILPWDGMVDRVAFLPFEFLNIRTVMGRDFSVLVKKKGDHFCISKTRPIEPSEVRLDRLRSTLNAHIAKQAPSDSKVVASVQTKPVPQIDDSLMEDEIRPPLPKGRSTPTIKQAPNTTLATNANLNTNEVVMIDDDTPAQSSSDIPTPKPRVHLPVSLVFDDVTGKVSIDWEVKEIPAKPSIPPRPPALTPVATAAVTPAVTAAATPAVTAAVIPAVTVPVTPAVTAAVTPAVTPTQPVKNSSKASALKRRNFVSRKAVAIAPAPQSNQVQATKSTTPAATRGRPNPPVTNLKTLLNQLDDDVIPPSQPERPPNSDPEVVVVDGVKQPPAPKPTQRRTRRKRADKAPDRAAETEQRASRMRSAVVSALQEDPETRRHRAARSSTTNGHAKTKKKVGFSGRRMSRRSRKNLAPILDSSGSEKEYRRDQDDDFTIDTEDVIEVLPISKANGACAAAPNLSPPTSRPPPPSLGRDAPGGLTEIESLDGSDMISPQMRLSEPRGKQSSRKVSRSGSSKHVRSHKSGTSSSRRERHRQVDEETHEGEPELWNREVLRVQRLLEENERNSDPLHNQIEYNPYRFYEQVPILRRVIKAAKAQHGHLMDMDKVDEYEEMAQFYNDTRNDPPFGSGSGCPGTEFLESVFQQTERERLNAMHGYAGESTENALDVLDEERFDFPMPSKRSTGVVNLIPEAGRASSPSQGSSESSAGSSEEDDEMYAAGSKRSRSQARSRASKARELQSRVCGDLLATMTNEAKRRVLRWAERDFTWFDRGVDVMEIVASRAFKKCPRCDSGTGEGEENCEESILLKLWKDMSWRKVRRMRHRSSGTN